MITSLSDDTFELFISRIRNPGIVDLGNAGFIDPYGMVGLLEAGRMLKLRGETRTLVLPRSDMVLKYLERMDFFKYAERYFRLDPEQPEFHDKYLRRSYSDVLLEITPIERSNDIHFIVDKVKQRSHTILEKHLHYDERAINGFIVALSEVCQNIVEHSGNTGYVGIQKYRFQKLNKNVVKIAVMDLGMGFKNSLSERISAADDLEAIDRALFHAVSRYDDEGRGHGLAAVRRFVDKWNGKFSIRSGGAKLSIVPRWSWGRKRETGLIHFPGAQISLILPEM